jgi:hypothetical protein
MEFPYRWPPAEPSPFVSSEVGTPSAVSDVSTSLDTNGPWEMRICLPKLQRGGLEALAMALPI